jgi:RNA polymerase sigma-70 factor (ECF subfamily)
MGVKFWQGRRHSGLMTHATAVSRLAEPESVLELTAIHDEYSDFVWRSLQRLGVTARNLEDALQDVFLVVHRRLGTYDGSCKISTWLFGICLRVASSYRRRAHTRYEFEDVSLEPVDQRPLADPEEHAMRREAERRLDMILDTMALERRAVFTMFEIEGMPAQAIADMLEIPLGTVHSRLHKARAEFAEALARQQATRKAGGYP